MENDGDPDILLASNRGIIWYENKDGKGTFGTDKSVADTGAHTNLFAADVDGDGDVDLLSDIGPKIVWYEQLARVLAGDANRDGHFDQRDIVKVLQAGKYLTGQPATFEEGDWNGDDVFDQRDILAALQTGAYVEGPYAARTFDAAFAEMGMWRGQRLP